MQTPSLNLEDQELSLPELVAVYSESLRRLAARLYQN